MGTVDLVQNPSQSPEQILANEQLQWLMQKGLDATNIQDDAITAALVDPSAPNAPTGVTLTGSGTYQDDKQGLTRAYATLSWTNPTANFGDAVVLYRQAGQTLWMHATRTTGTTARIDGLECGLNYDFGVQAVSQFNIAGAVASLTSQLMPGDTSGPTAPGTPTIIDKKLTTISFGWGASSSKDVGGYECEIRTASGGGGSQVWTGRADSTFITVDQATIGFGVTRYFRVRALDYTKNAGSWTSDVSFSFVQAVTGDVGSGQITSAQISTGGVTTSNIATGAVTGTQISTGGVTTSNIADQGVTTPKRQNQNSTSVSYSVANGTSQIYTLTHNLGVIPSTGYDVAITVPGNAAGTQVIVNTTQAKVLIWNQSGATISGTLTMYYW